MPTVTSTSKERVLTTFANQEADRVPIDYFGNLEIDWKLKQHFGLKRDDNEGLRQSLGIDFREINPPYIGPKLHADIPERGVSVNEWGVHTVWAENESGGYWDFCDFPLTGATEEEVAAWPMPSPDDYDYSGIESQCKRYEHYAIFTGNAGMGDIINSSSFLRGMEGTLMDLMEENPAALLLIDRRQKIQLEVLHRTLEAAKGRIDFLWLGEDLGTQRGPMISKDLYRAVLRPRHQKFIDAAKSSDLQVMIHTCGASSWAYEDFIEMGITAIDTLQPEAVNMAPAILKKTFGGRLAFHGCISTAGPLAYGTVNEVIQNCRETLEIMMPGGGYFFSPTHAIQDNSPLENVLAMYETAKCFGNYR